jgi:hypothetical protein
MESAESVYKKPRNFDHSLKATYVIRVWVDLGLGTSSYTDKKRK